MKKKAIKTETIFPGIYLLRPSTKCTFPYSNSLYINGEQRILIDAGSGTRAYRDVIGAVDQILLSHYHFDHINCLDCFSGVPVQCGREETWAYNDQKRFMAALGYELWDDLMGEPRTDWFAEVFERQDDIPIIPGYRNIPMTGTFQDRTIFEIGGLSVQAVHTPGHTPGHYAFYFPEEELLFSADIDLSPWGPWYSALVSDFDAMVNSIQKVRQLKPKMIISSHRHQIFTENIDHLLAEHLRVPLTKEKRILEYLEQPRSFLDVAEQDFIHVYPPKTKFQVFWNRMMLLKHLERLLKHGAVIRTEAGLYLRERDSISLELLDELRI